MTRRGGRSQALLSAVEECDQFVLQETGADDRLCHGDKPRGSMHTSGSMYTGGTAMDAPTATRLLSKGTARRRPAALWLGTCLLVLWSGCGYMVGDVRAPEICTVHVPTFTSEGFRRGFDLQLTEAVQKQVQMRGYRLAKPPEADTRLVGHIASVDKRPVNQNRFDDPRELELALAINVRWEDARTGQLLSSTNVPLDALGTQAVTQTTFAPETGQSLATGTQQAVDTLARRIVEMMEIPW